MKLSIVMVVYNKFDMAYKSLNSFISNTKTENVEFLVIDNGSETPFSYNNPKVRIIRNDKNTGVLPPLTQGWKESTGDIIFYTHQDVLIYEQGYDEVIINAFSSIPRLAVAGLVGSKGMNFDMTRRHVISRMIGGEWGFSWEQHGRYADQKITPATVMDGCTLIIKRYFLEAVEGFDNSYLAHHMYDADICLKSLQSGWKNAVLGIDFDHQGGATSTGAEYNKWAREYFENEMGKSVEEYFREKKAGGNIRPLPPVTRYSDNDPDGAIHYENHIRFFNKWQSFLPVEVMSDWNVRHF